MVCMSQSDSTNARTTPSLTRVRMIPIVELGLQARCSAAPYLHITEEANTSCHHTDAITLSFLEYHSFKCANQLQLILALSVSRFLLAALQ